MDPLQITQIVIAIAVASAILLQARGVRWAIIAVAGLVGFLAGLSHWVIAKA